MMLAKFRQQYPQGSLIGELVKIDRGIYIVKVLVRVNDIILATALAGANTVEAAEDNARERAISSLLLDESSTSVDRSSTTVDSTASDRPAVNSPVQPSTPSPDKNEPRVKSNQESKNVNFYEDRLETGSARSPVFAPETVAEPETVSFAASESDRSDLEASEPTTAKTLFDDTFTADTSPATLDNGFNSESLAKNEPTTEPTPTAEPEAMDFNEIKQKTDIEIKRLGWTKDDGREFLKSRYGKRSRLHLTDEQLLEFLQYLEKQPNPVS